MRTSLSPTANGYLLMHLCVVLWGFTPILGRLITLDALDMIWWRMVIATAALLFVPAVWREVQRMPLRLLGAYSGIGVILAAYWVLFYLAIKLANASVGAVTMGTAPLFLAFIEPALAHRGFRARELVLGIGVIPGIALAIGGVPSGMLLGFGVGILSIVFIVIFSIFNKRLIERAHPLSVTFIELAAGAAFLTPIVLLRSYTGATFPVPHGSDLWLLLVLSLALTLLPIVLLLVALRNISAFAQQVATNLEPVYAVLLAIPILGEQRELSPLFYVGAVVIIGSTILEPWLGSLRTRHV